MGEAATLGSTFMVDSFLPCRGAGKSSSASPDFFPFIASMRALRRRATCFLASPSQAAPVPVMPQFVFRRSGGGSHTAAHAGPYCREGAAEHG